MAWRRRIAMFCIVMLSALAFIPAHAESESPSYATFAHVVVHSHDDANADPQHGSPAQNGSEPHAHHCGGPHAGDVYVESAGIKSRRAVQVVFAQHARWPITNPTYSLDRPPRPIA